MTNIDIISGFLGAGKTTLIKKLLQEAYPDEKLVLIENEFGSVNIDGGFLKESGVEISEMSAGCICCSLVGDFTQALLDVHAQFKPDRILIEPSGVGKLSDVIAAVERTTAQAEDMVLGSAVTVADGSKVKVYEKNFGEFYIDQVAHAGAIFLSRTQKLSQEKVQAAVDLLRTHNATAAIVTTPWDELSAMTMKAAMTAPSLEKDLLAEVEEHHHEQHHEHGEGCGCGHDHHEHHHEHGEGCGCGHDHHEHHHEHGEGCGCGHDHHEHHHEHGEGCGCGHDHHEHHHEHGEGCGCGHDHHEHHHEHGEGCGCGHDHHEHHHEHGEGCGCGHDHHEHHHAEDVFTSWGIETPHVFTKAQLEFALNALDSGDFGMVLRAKGIVPTADGWLEFDYVPEEVNLRPASADYTGRLCVIGAGIDETQLATLFGL